MQAESGQYQTREPQPAPVEIAREESHSIAIEQRPLQRAETERRPVEQPIVPEYSAVETRQPEIAAAVIIPERQHTPEPAMEKRDPQPVMAEVRATPAWKMAPVTLPSDLVMIETQRRNPGIPSQEEDVPHAVRTPRPRYQPPPIPEEPLQQVETGKQHSADGDSAG
jgi:hypothetical protein